MATKDKYDRQLRLWGSKGQRSLAETTVVLLRATAAGTETLKNLVLPGIGGIWIVDDDAGYHHHQQQQGSDSNFFTTMSCTTTASSEKTRAQVAMEHLQELNPDVRGQYTHVESLRKDWDGQPIVSTTTSSPITKLLVIASDLEPPLLLQVSRLCAQHQVPLICVESYGLLGYIRIQTPPLPLLDPKPENEPPDLRLVTSFPKLDQLASTIDWNSLDNHQHGHIPYPLILLKLQTDWKTQHDGCLPTTMAEKQAFRETISTMSRNFSQQLNFQEASQNAYLAYTEKRIDDHALSLLLLSSSSETLVKSLSKSSLSSCRKFHALLQALQAFRQQHHGRAPLHGTIPDMTASTELYVQLQRLYHDQAAQDVSQFQQLLLVQQEKQQDFTDDEIATFCKNVFSLDMLTTRTVEEEGMDTASTTPDLVEEWTMALMDPYEVPEHTPFLWYMGLRACRVFYQRHGRYPGTLETEYSQDVMPLQECIVEVTRMMQLQEQELVQQTLLTGTKYAEELTRYGQGEIHNIASVVGGVASQEAVKMITSQYVPLNNTYIFNGIASTAGVYEF